MAQRKDESREDYLARRRAYNAAHREERRAYQAAYNSTHREESRAYKAAHREERLAYQAAYDAAHREERRAYKAAYYAAHREERLAYWREYERSARGSSTRTRAWMKRLRSSMASKEQQIAELEALLREINGRSVGVSTSEEGSSQSYAVEAQPGG